MDSKQRAKMSEAVDASGVERACEDHDQLKTRTATHGAPCAYGCPSPSKERAQELPKKESADTTMVMKEAEQGEHASPSPSPHVELDSKRRLRRRKASKKVMPFAHQPVTKIARYQKASSQHSKVKSKARVFTTSFVRPMDIICSRGRPYHKHPGNVRFLAIVDAHRHTYDAASRKEKASIAATVVGIARSSQFGGYGREIEEGQGQNSTSDSATAPVLVSTSVLASSSVVTTTGKDDTSLPIESMAPVRFLRRVAQDPSESGTAEDQIDASASVLQDNGKRKSNNDTWFEVSDVIAVDKASHALRSKYRTVRYSAADVHAATQKSSKHNKPDLSRARLPPLVDTQSRSMPEIPASAAQQEHRQDASAADVFGDNEAVSETENVAARPTVSSIATVPAGTPQDRVQNDRAPSVDRTAEGSQTNVNQAILQELQREAFLTSQLLNTQYQRARQIAQAELAEQHALAVLRVSRQTALAGLGASAAGMFGGAVRPSVTPFATLMHVNSLQLQLTMNPQLSLVYAPPPMAASLSPLVIRPILNSVAHGQSSAFLPLSNPSRQVPDTLL